MNITVSEVEDRIVVFNIFGRLDASNSIELKSIFENELQKYDKFVFNLENLEFIDSTGLGGLVYCLKIADQKKGAIKIASLQPKPKLVFDTTKAENIFDIYDDLNSALKSFPKK